MDDLSAGYPADFGFCARHPGVISGISGSRFKATGCIPINLKRKEADMAQKSDVFKCPECKHIVAVLQSGKGELQCCGKTMVNVTPDEAKRLLHDMQRPGAP